MLIERVGERGGEHIKKYDQVGNASKAYHELSDEAMSLEQLATPRIPRTHGHAPAAHRGGKGADLT
eukprot:5263550-Pyramimonas_sp.AAC.1